MGKDKSDQSKQKHRTIHIIPWIYPRKVKNPKSIFYPSTRDMEEPWGPQHYKHHRCLGTGLAQISLTSGPWAGRGTVGTQCCRSEAQPLCRERRHLFMGILLSVHQSRQGQLRDIGMGMHMVCCSRSMMDQPTSCDKLHGG